VSLSRRSSNLEMSGRKRGPKASIQGSKPEPPPFIARIRQQLVENEDAERRIRSEKRRREGGIHSTGDEEDDPRVVKLNEDDLTEEEYKRMKLGEYRGAFGSRDCGELFD